MQPKVAVEGEALQEFRRAVFERHGQLYGRLREEATAALREHAAKLRRQG